MQTGSGFGASAQARGDSPGSRRPHCVRAACAAGLEYRISRDAVVVLDWSRAGIVVDGVNLASGASVEGSPRRGTTREEYPTRGVHAVARSHSNDVRYEFKAKNGTPFAMDVRVFNDGAAFRFLVPGSGSRTPDEATTFNLPAGSMTWTHDLHGHYEAVYVKRVIDDVPTGDWAAPPVTYKLPGNGGYASITEAALTGYAGMALHAEGAAATPPN